MSSFKFLLLTSFAPHPDYSLDFSEHLKNLYLLSRFFPHHTISFTTWAYNELEDKTVEQMMEFDAIFIGGSPWNVDDNQPWMLHQKTLLLNLIEKKIYPPIFGICFGMQLLSDILGGTVENLPTPIRGPMPFLVKHKKIKNWANHRQYVSRLPRFTEEISTIQLDSLSIPYLVRFRKNIWGIQPHPERNIGETESETFWSEFFQSKTISHVLGSVECKNITLRVFSTPKPCTEISYDNDGKYLGIKGQCVELVRRYLYKKTGKNFADFWQDGNAKDWFFNAEKMNLLPILEKKHLQEGDILCFDKGFYDVGHVAMVKEILDDGIIIFQQNVFQDERDLHYFLPFSSFAFKRFLYQGALRIPEKSV